MHTSNSATGRLPPDSLARGHLRVDVRLMAPKAWVSAREKQYHFTMAAFDPRSISVRELLQTYCDVMDELRRREVLRSSNNPVADYSELLFCRAFGWSRQGGSASGFDATCGKGLRYQIKGRRLTPSNPSRQLSFIRKLPERQFHFLAGILFHNGFAIKRAALVPHAIVEARARYSKHANGWLFELKDEIWDAAEVIDVTKELLLTSEQLG